MKALQDFTDEQLQKFTELVIREVDDLPIEETKREWAVLTDDEAKDVRHKFWHESQTFMELLRTIEAKLKEKNHMNLTAKDGGTSHTEHSNKTEFVPCKTHPDAPHGFCRNASHAEGRYVCECEYWEPEEEKNT